MTQPRRMASYAYNDNAVRNLPGPGGETQKPFALYAVLYTWYEEDIIEACVKNLFAEGVERVFLIDNDSPDATVEVAVQAGAIHRRTVRSERFTEAGKCEAVFGLVQTVMEEEDRERIWWLFCDADEFPAAPGSETIHGYLAGLDDRIRVVGGHFITHYPMEFPHYCPGFHPVEFQFRATPSYDIAIYCERIHDKHNLVRFDNGRFDMRIHGGYHRITRESPLYEAPQSLGIHHVQYRNREHTLQRLDALSTPGANGCSRLGDAEFHRRVAAGERVSMRWYVDRRALAEKIYTPPLLFDAPPREWQGVAQSISGTPHMIRRWYAEEQLFSALRSRIGEEAFSIWLLHWLMMYAEPEQFLIQLERTEKANLRAEHVYYAAQCHAALGRAENALLVLRDLPGCAASGPQPDFTADSARLHVKNIIVGKAPIVIPL